VPTPDDFVTRPVLAELLGVEERTITNYRNQFADFPVRVRGRTVDFPLKKCVQWYIKFREREYRERFKSEGAEETREFDRRTRIADLVIKEANAAERLKKLTTVDAAERLLADYASRVRAVHISAPSKYARAKFPELQFSDALKRLQDIFDAVEISLQRDDDDTAESEAA
jgi:phage terminase Nu1 subunit (DNA packaging protein)